MKIALVGENPGALLSMARATFTVDHAVDGDELADLLAAFTYDAVVLDRLPRGEVLPQISSVRSVGKRVPILAVGVDEAATRIACLREGARATEAPATVHAARIEDVIPRLTGVEVLTARALAPLPRLCLWGKGLIATGTLGLFLKGEEFASESATVLADPAYVVDFVESRTQAGASVVRVRAASPRAQPQG